jgi:hypothetical protein
LQANDLFEPNRRSINNCPCTLAATKQSLSASNDQALFSNSFCRLHCDVPISLHTYRAGEANVQRGGIGSARILVLAADRWTKMLVRGQAHALEVIAGVAGAGVGTAGFQHRARKRRDGEAQRSIGCTGLGATFG